MYQPWDHQQVCASQRRRPPSCGDLLSRARLPRRITNPLGIAHLAVGCRHAARVRLLAGRATQLAACPIPLVAQECGKLNTVPTRFAPCVPHRPRTYHASRLTELRSVIGPALLAPKIQTGTMGCGPLNTEPQDLDSTRARAALGKARSGCPRLRRDRTEVRAGQCSRSVPSLIGWCHACRFGFEGSRTGGTTWISEPAMTDRSRVQT